MHPHGPDRAKNVPGADVRLDRMSHRHAPTAVALLGLCAALGARADTPPAFGPSGTDDPVELGPANGPSDALVPDLPDPGGDLRPDAAPGGALTDRARVERREAFNPYLLTAHRHNFVLPIAWSPRFEDDPYVDAGFPDAERLNTVELRFQLSAKVRLNGSDLLLADDGLFFGLTLAAWWQVYAADASRPFRETNYRPELFYLAPVGNAPFGGRFRAGVGIEHESNGRSVPLSRGWNRLYAQLIYERDALVVALRPWYRLPEDDKETPEDPSGDDNPDILDYHGHGELFVGHRRGRREIGLRVHGNPGTDRGGARLGATFPLGRRFRAYAEYFEGCGASLIDHDRYLRQLGVGIAFTNLY